MYFRSLYWIFAAAVLLVVTTVLTASVPNGDVYHENTLPENERFFANQTKDGIYQEQLTGQIMAVYEKVPRDDIHLHPASGGTHIFFQVCPLNDTIPSLL
uniref:Uncharacterized protein n=1 Tax=Anopheles funestus TaxID=62324 RepID=A0A4Y0BFR5_ANOFN